MAQGRLVLIGAGHMGGALAKGWLSRRGGPTPVIIDPKPSSTVTEWADSGQITLNSEPEAAGTLVIAVKPQIFLSALDTILPWIGPKTLVISIMAGWRIEQLGKHMRGARIVRAMPNTPGSVGQGVTLVSPGPTATKADIASVTGLMQPLGLVEGPMSENELALATGISGSGPAYLFLLAEVLAAAGEAEGMDEAFAMRLARQTVIGSAALLAASETDPAELRRAVTSPGGVTQAALDVLMDDGGMPTLFRQAIRAAVQRDRKLSRLSEEDQ